MNYENSTIPFSDTTQVMTVNLRETIGEPKSPENKRYGRLFLSPKINKWSKNKPKFFLINGNPLTEQSDRSRVSGFAMTGQKHLNVNILEYKRPEVSRRDIPYRLRDIVGYKHKSKAPELLDISSPENQHLNTVSNNTEVSYTMMFKTSEISIYDLTGGGTYGSCNGIVIYRMHTSGAGYEVIGHKQLTNAETTTEGVQVHNITVNLGKYNLPRTTPVTERVWVAFGDVNQLDENKPIVATPRYIIGNIDLRETTARIYFTVIVKPDFTNPNQWQRAHVSGGSGVTVKEIFSDNDMTGADVFYKNWKVWMHPDAPIGKYQIDKLSYALGPRGGKLMYKAGSTWKKLIDLPSSHSGGYFSGDIPEPNTIEFRIDAIDLT